MPDIQDLTNDLIETMSARRAAINQAMEALVRLGNGAPPKVKARRPKSAKPKAATPARKAVAAKSTPILRMPKDAFLEVVTGVLRSADKPMRVVALRDALLRGPCKGRNPKALYNQVCNSLAGKKQFKRTAEGVALA